MKTIIKLIIAIAACFTMSSCYLDDTVYVGQRPYIVVQYPPVEARTVVVRHRPSVMFDRRPAPPPPARGPVHGRYMRRR